LEPTSSREKRRTIVYLRGLMLVALGGLLLEAGAAQAGTYGLALLAVYALSNISLLLSVPLSVIRSLKFELTVGAVDLLAVGLAVALAGSEGGVLPVSCLILALVLALAHYRTHAVAGTAAVCGLHAWLLLAVSDGSMGQLTTQLLFLGSLALYYGYLAAGIHSLRRRESAENLSFRELRTLLEILDAITTATDLEQVTRIVVKKISEIVPAVRCSMLFIDKSQTRCFVMASHEAPEVKMLEVSLEKYPEVRRAIETRNPVLVQDIAKDPMMEEVRGILEQLDLHSIMVVPMIFGDDLLGTICMKTARANQPFSQRELNFCNAVARASASALKNAALHREVTETSGLHRTVAEKLARIVDHSPDLIMTTDSEGHVTEFNRAAESLLGYRREFVLGRACDDVFGERIEGVVERTLADGPVANLSCTLRKEDGNWLEVELNTSVLRDESGQSAGTIWLGRDVSELKATHRRLLQAEKLSTIGEVISGVAHELNNPLSGVLGYSQLLLARNEGGSMTRGLERIHESALRCQKIVSNLLSFARGHKPERRYLGINGLIEKTLDIKKYQLRVHGIEIERELDPELPLTLIDFHQMQQVLLNLLNNAQHAMSIDGGGSGCLRIRTVQDGGWIRIEISDTGEGMDSVTLERIFDPFFTTKEVGQGTGLGLSVSYGIINEHGGRIYARSEKGEGSTFVIELPVHEKPVTVAEAAPEETSTMPRAAAGGERILVVDDEPMILDLLVEVLGEQGYAVDTAGSGEEAYRKIEPAGYDLVISDVRMPQMTGIDLYRRIVSSQPELAGKVIFITGDLMDRDTIEFLAGVRAKTLPKPLDIDAVLDAVAESLASEAVSAASSVSS